MVQAGVNPFTVSPGFSTAQTLNASDNNLHVAVAVKNDPLLSSVKQDTGVAITPNLSLAQVKWKPIMNDTCVKFTFHFCINSFLSGK